MEKNIEKIQIDLNRLQIKWQYLEKISDRSSIDFERKVLVLADGIIKFRIDASRNHFRPHIHIDYGKQFHAISIALDNSEILDGKIPIKYYKGIEALIEKNRQILLDIWKDLRASKDVKPLIELIGK